jgi:hypothetical protein
LTTNRTIRSFILLVEVHHIGERFENFYKPKYTSFLFSLWRWPAFSLLKVYSFHNKLQYHFHQKKIQKKYILTPQLRNSTCRYLPFKKLKPMSTQRLVHKIIIAWFLMLPKWKPLRCPSKIKYEKLIMIVVRNKNEWSTDTQSKTNKSQKHCVERKKQRQ